MFAISTPSTIPSAVPSGERPARLVGVDVDLQRARVADDEQRVAERLELGLERVGVEALALDHEHRAVAVARELLVDRLEARAPRAPPATSGSASPAYAAARPRTISSSPAPPASTTPASRRIAELLGRAGDGLLAAAHERRRNSTVGSCFVSRPLAPPRPARGSPRASSPRRGGARRGRRRRWRSGRRVRAPAASSVAASPSTSAAPRTIWLKMTPELPRAPISAARASSFATASWPVACRGLERLDDRAHRQRQVRAGVPVGHRDRRSGRRSGGGSPRGSRARRGRARGRGRSRVMPTCARPRCAPRRRRP